ncbi:unnamed protein product [Brachionus calyciflorus]|uniref:Nuclear receptor n=1 Tax=Brachionus calyciflorus TaxID=104777 RepID=A0A814DVC7_9BILA|nr:unnamed protein product [Brachionus calyciflorus]
MRTVQSFFKRSLLRHPEYKCNKSQNCSILPRKTKKCKFCRWHKCLKEGMSVDKIRMGIIPNSIKKHNVNNSIQDLTEINKNNKISEFLKSIPFTFYREKFLNSSNQNQVLVLSLLKDKTYQLFQECNEGFDTYETRALNILQSGYVPIENERSQENIDFIRQTFLSFLQNHALAIYKFINNLPGFDRLDKHDMNVMMNDNFFSILGYRTYKLFLEDDCFLMLDENIQFDKKIASFVLGDDIQKRVFKYCFKITSFNLTEVEIALSTAFILTTFSKNLLNMDLVRELNEYYGRALYYVLTLNKRNKDFLERYIAELCKLPQMNKLCLDTKQQIKLIYIRSSRAHGESLSADFRAADDFLKELPDILNGYNCDQIYNADECGLNYHCLPTNSLIGPMEKHLNGYKSNKERVTLMACSNASGEHKLKLVFINKCENPGCFTIVPGKRSIKNDLPVYYTSLKNA